MQEVTLTAFGAAVADPATALSEPLLVAMGAGARIPVRVLRRARHAGAQLVVLFHGSVNRQTVTTPVFEGAFLEQTPLDDATVLSVADPLLERDPELKAAWYAGAHDQDTRGLLRELVDTVVQATLPRRVIYVGGSTGGHPALVQSHDRPGSIAVVINPIVRISGYHPEYVQTYRRTCWPALADNAALADVALDDLRELYARPATNTVIYLQNARDGHFWHQAMPFVSSLRGMNRMLSVLFLSNYFPNHPGHSFPPAIWARWVHAACIAADTDPEAIAAAAAALEPAAAAGGERRASRAPSAHDLALADRLSAWHQQHRRS